MAFIQQVEAESLKEKLTDDPAQLNRLYRSKKNDYHTRSVEHNLVEDMIKDGWEEYGKPLVTKTRLRKLKNHNEKFEDDIWCQLYELGYRILNFTNNFHLPYGKTPKEKKQIDVVAINEDSILLIECKSSRNLSKPPSFKTEFEGLPIRLDGFNKTLEQLFGKGRKVKYIFATRNLRLDHASTDIERLLDTNSFFYDDNTYEYVKSLIEKYKDAAQYQFLAMLFRGQSISKDKIEVPAIEGKMGNQTYYMFSIEPHLLLKMGFVLHRTKANNEEMPTYQRLLVPSRLKGIAKFIEEGGYFPNSIILNFDTKKNRMHFEPSIKGGDSLSKSGMLKIPNAYAIAYIIDGQHRVYGYAQSPYKENNTIPVVAFKDLDSSEQLKLFMDINENQKAVSPTLRITLEEDLYWDSDRADTRMKALRSSVIQKLNNDISGPLYGRISIGEDKSDLPAKPFSNALTQSGLIPSAKGNKFTPGAGVRSLYDINNHSHDKEMRRARGSITKFINLCYQFASDTYPDVFEREGGFIMSSRGTYAFICLIGSLNKHKSEQGNVKVETSSSDRFEAIKDYLSDALRKINEMPKEDEERLLRHLGAGADMAWLRTYQYLLNKIHPEFNPEGLSDWKERQDQELQSTARYLIEEIEKYIKSTVIKNLQILFGEDWELEIGSIQRECEKRASEEKEKRYKEGLPKKDIHWTEMFFIKDYKSIIEKYWTKKPDSSTEEFNSFDELFSIDIGGGFNSKADKIKWISIFGSHRNSIAHQGTKEKGLNKDEVDELHTIYDNLMQ